MLFFKLKSWFVPALLFTWLGWGSSFLAMVYTLNSIPPLLMMSSRFIVAGMVVILMHKFMIKRKAIVTGKVIRDLTVSGIAMISIGMGASGWAAARLDSGVTALLSAAIPLWIAIFSSIYTRSVPKKIVVVGLIIGVVGVGVLALSGGSSRMNLPGITALLVCGIAWAVGSLVAEYSSSSGDVMFDTSIRMISGGVALIPVSIMLGELGKVNFSQISYMSIIGWLYLVIVCSIGGFLSLEWLIKNQTSVLASTYAFVNPIVAIILGTLVLGEVITLRMLISVFLIIAAVILLLRSSIETIESDYQHYHEL